MAGALKAAYSYVETTRSWQEPVVLFVWRPIGIIDNVPNEQTCMHSTNGVTCGEKVTAACWTARRAVVCGICAG